MGIISDLIPTNYEQQKDKFLADPTFDPQFKYLRDFSNEELLKRGLPSDRYLTQAQQILDLALKDKLPEDFDSSRGELLTQQQVTTAINDFLKGHDLTDWFSIVWSKKFVSRASVTDENVVKLRLPCSIKEHDLAGLIYHEIGTHVLRRINYQQQPWYKNKRKYGFSPYLKTEEGLATLHSLFPKENKLAYMAAVNYLAVQKAQESSFLEVWYFVKQYIHDDERAFAMTFKKKRGLEDTQRAGGFTKDLVYFEGLVDVVQFLIKADFPVKELYFGKLSWQDIAKAVELNPDFKPLLPSFYTADPEKYQQLVKEVAEANLISSQ